MKKEDVNIFLAGAGNHPVMLFGSLIARAAFYDGYDIKNTSVIALGVIGGAVVSQIRLGEHICSPLFQEGQGDYMVAFDRLEALRNCYQLKESAMIIVSDEIVPPTSVTGLIESPVKRTAINWGLMESKRKIINISREEYIASDIDSQMVLIGALSNRIEISLNSWGKAMDETFSKELIKMKRKGFEYGRRVYIS